MKAHGIWLAALGSAVIMTGCGGISDCKSDGATCAQMLVEHAGACAEAYQLKQSNKKRKHCEQAIATVAKGKVTAAVPGLLALLSAPETSIPDDKHRREAAKALGQIGDASAVDGLIAALEYSAGTSSDPKDKAANRSNEEIATALGRLGSDKAVDPLLKLIDKSRDNYVVLKAVRALGQIGNPAAVERLSEIALEHDNKFMRKNAVIALGDIGDPKAIDPLIRMMFVEFGGVSFYKEASFALFQVGPKAAEALLETMALKNEKVNKIFEKSGGLKNSAIKAKCGFVLGDLRDKRAVDPLIESFKTAAKDKDPVVIVYAAAPLGALGDSRAVPVLKAEMATLDASQRDPIMGALNQLGDRSVVPAMITAMSKPHFVKECIRLTKDKEGCSSSSTKASLYGAQKAAADHASNLAGPEHLAAFKKALEAEADPKMQTYFKARLKRVEAAAECKSDAKCWVKKLTDADELIREKAAWELGRAKDASALDALGKALGDKKTKVRSAAIFAYWSYGDKRVVEAIKKRLEDEESSADYIRVNEDLRRLLVYLERKS